MLGVVAYDLQARLLHLLHKGTTLILRQAACMPSPIMILFHVRTAASSLTRQPDVLSGTTQLHPVSSRKCHIFDPLVLFATALPTCGALLGITCNT